MKSFLHALTSFLFQNRLLLAFTVWASPAFAYTQDDTLLSADPWDRALGAVLLIMTGPTATLIGSIALASTGYLFLRGRIDVMRLLAIIAGLGLIFGAPHLAQLLQHQAS